MVLPPVGKGLFRSSHRYAEAAIAGAAVACSIALTAPLAVASPPAGVTAQSPAIAKASLSDDVDAAKAQLEKASNIVQAADDAVDSANAKLPGANKAIAVAEQAVAAADAAVDVATAAVDVANKAKKEAEQQAAAAQAQVKVQLGLVAQAQQQVEKTRTQIAGLARQAYLSGSDSTELAILMNTKSPGDFVQQLASMKRVSQSNKDLFNEMTAKQAALAATLVTLKGLQDEAAAAEQDARNRAADVQAKADAVIARAQDAQDARNSAQARKQDVVDLIAVREAKQAEALAKRKTLKATYEDLQQKLLAATGSVNTTGTKRNVQQAIAWGMEWLGRGSNYDGLCLGFADDMYGVLDGHQRHGSAIEQWYALKRAGKAHPGDDSAPIGAQFYWDIPGYPYGHVATYVGGGMLLTTSAYSGSRVGLRSLEAINSWLGVHDLGWAEPYYPK